MSEGLISADSHVSEVPDLWETGLPRSFKERTPGAGKRSKYKTGQIFCCQIPP